MEETLKLGGDIMALNLKERRAVIREIYQRYLKSSKKEKSLILDEFTALTGYSRSYASFVLRNYSKSFISKSHGKITIFKGDHRMKRKRKRKRIYDEKVLKVLKYLWEFSDFLCGKRLVPFIRNVLPILIREGEIKIEKGIEEKLMKKGT